MIGHAACTVSYFGIKYMIRAHAHTHARVFTGTLVILLDSVPLPFDRSSPSLLPALFLPFCHPRAYLIASLLVHSAFPPLLSLLSTFSSWLLFSYFMVSPHGLPQASIQSQCWPHTDSFLDDDQNHLSSYVISYGIVMPKTMLSGIPCFLFLSCSHTMYLSWYQAF